MFLKIAIRNVFRHRRRTILTVLVMSVGVVFFIFFDSLFIGIDKMLIEELLKYQDGAIVIYSKEYAQNKKAYPLDKPIKNPQKIVNLVKSFKDIEVTFRTNFLAELIYFEKSKYIVATAIDPTTDTKVFNLHNKIKEGRFLIDDNRYEILLGKKLADEFGVKVGDTVILSAYTKYNTYNALEFVVCGLLETTVPTINESSVFLTLKCAEELLTLDGSVTSAHIKVPWKKGEKIATYTKKVLYIVERLKKELYSEYEIYSFRELYNDFIVLMDQKKLSSFIIVFFLLLISAVGIANTILMAVYERIKEIGVLMAFGFKPKQIRKLFLLEGVVMGVIGGFLGCVLGVGLNFWLVYSGWNLEALYAEETTGLKASQLGVPVWGRFYGEWNIYAYLFCFCFCILVAVFSSYFPARYASKLQVRDCLKFV
ncbi:MAG: FtsX-like permease family protein [Endomicrobia bacterium]|nr:FtsX-like permease family protein [Endomicrobiia bacterium]